MSKVIVVGGGAAGMMASIAAAGAGDEVTLIEKNEKLGKKLFITGKGRCNVTNSSDIETIFSNINRNPKFMYSALESYDNNDIIRDIESEGCKVKEERGGRMFPVSDHSSDVIRALSNMLEKAGVEVRLRSEVKKLSKTENGFEVTLSSGKKENADAVVVATGGVSYAATGSTGDGFEFAKGFGHTVTDLKPSLVPLVTSDGWCKDL
ncbi:MAG: aminoacetone oxidase family FAD-binding enzyme, partial [Lachnospiraceae bacterium]|nr:aminoacetone oxidase family FAD-binding enzyme [Lachnospiraceae bacterium]